MHILIVEDEQMVARALVRMITSIFNDRTHILHHTETLSAAKKYIENEKVGLLFLDLNLDGEDGFTLLADLVSRPFQTIIVSANTHRAIKAFNYGAIDFVAKPFVQERLVQAINRLDLKQENAGAATAAAEVLGVRHRGSTRLVRVEQLAFAKGADNYSELHLTGGEVLLHEKNLRQLMCVLPQSFQRTHKSYVTNMNLIQALKNHPGSKYELELISGHILPIGRNYLTNLRTRLD